MRDKICEMCAFKCASYEGIMAQPELEITECANFVRIVKNRNCFDCKYADIFESSHEWLSCRCKAYGDVKDGGLYSNNCSKFECVKGAVLREGN